MATRHPASRLVPIDGLWLAMLALALIVGAFLLQKRNEINLIDEGYLWYGAFAVLKGQVPLRDFQSYDPGRYYWVAAWFRLLGENGIVPLRIACAAFNWIGLLCGLLVLRRISRAWYVLVAGGALITLWVFPPFMLNCTVVLAAVYFAVLVIERPSRFRHFLAGVFVGLGAIVGRHLTVYALPSFSLLIGFVWWRVDRRDLFGRLLAWVAGMVVGYSPMLFMYVFVPGFWDASLDGMRLVFEMGTTNIRKPVPWPWQQSSAWGICLGLFFVLVPVVYVVAAAWLLRATQEALLKRPVLLAATFVGIPCLHYMFSRPDIEHLAMNIHPFILAVMALPFEAPRRWRRLTVGVVFAVAAGSVIAIGGASPLYQRMTAPPARYTPLDVGRWMVWEPRNHAGLIEGAIRFNANVLRPDEGFLVAPQLPALYPIMNRLSPIWQVIFIYPHPQWRQQKMIQELERNRTNWVLLEDVPTDGREDLRFRNTHRLMWDYINQNFEVVPEGLLEDFHLFKRKIPIGEPSPAAGHSTRG